MPSAHSSLRTLSLAATVLLSGCIRSQPDYTPFGDGMKAIGICLVVYGVVHALADLAKHERQKPGDRQSRDDYRPDDHNKPEGR